MLCLNHLYGMKTLMEYNSPVFEYIEVKIEKGYLNSSNDDGEGMGAPTIGGF